MNPPELIIEKLRKIKALADRGFAGEADVAKKKLEEMLNQNGLSLESLAASDVRMFEFPFQNEREAKLIMQVISSVLKTGKFRTYGLRQNGRKKKLVAVEMTPIQHLDVVSAFKYYRKIYQVEEERFFCAFVQKHELTAPADPDGESKLTHAELLAMLAMMNGMREKSFVKPVGLLEENKC